MIGTCILVFSSFYFLHPTPTTILYTFVLETIHRLHRLCIQASCPWRTANLLPRLLNHGGEHRVPCKTYILLWRDPCCYGARGCKVACVHTASTARTWGSAERRQMVSVRGAPPWHVALVPKLFSRNFLPLRSMLASGRWPRSLLRRGPRRGSHDPAKLRLPVSGRNSAR